MTPQAGARGVGSSQRAGTGFGDERAFAGNRYSYRDQNVQQWRWYTGRSWHLSAGFKENSRAREISIAARRQKKNAQGGKSGRRQAGGWQEAGRQSVWRRSAVARIARLHCRLACAGARDAILGARAIERGLALPGGQIASRRFDRGEARTPKRRSDEKSPGARLRDQSIGTVGDDGTGGAGGGKPGQSGPADKVAMISRAWRRGGSKQTCVGRKKSRRARGPARCSSCSMPQQPFERARPQPKSVLR